MKSVIMGKNIKKEYTVVPNQKEISDEKGKLLVFTNKPELKITEIVVSTKPILEVNGKVGCNRNDCGEYHLVDIYGGRYRINISENETVTVEKEIYRADLDEQHLFTDKIISIEDGGKVDAEKEYHTILADFNEQMIKSNDKMMAYCNLHKLDIREADCEEVFKLVYPNQKYKIAEGKMVVQSDSYDFSPSVFCSSSIPITTSLTTTAPSIGFAQ